MKPRLPVKARIGLLAAIVVLATTGCVPTIFRQFASNNGSTRPTVTVHVRPTGAPDDNPWFYVSALCYPTTRYSSVYNINDMPAALRRHDAEGDFMVVNIPCDWSETAINNSAAVIRL